MHSKVPSQEPPIEVPPLAAVSKRATITKQQLVTWGPLAAIIGTVVIYFVSQFLGSVLLLSVAWLRGWNQSYINAWVQQVWPQFMYVALVEGTTLAMLAWFIRRRKAVWAAIGLVRPKLRDLAYTGLGIVIYFPLLIAAMTAVQNWLPHINLDQPQQLGFSGAHGPALALVFISLCVLPPLTEEILVRGFLYSGLRSKLPKITAALIASLMFAAAHLEFGQNAPLLWSAAIDTFILSMVLIYLRERTGSLWASIGLHTFKNTIAFAALFIFAK
ncbi:MAG: CPBP family intramembrane glutamic endopeptidase [Candidatus Saccharimonadales bacterium]